MQSDGVRDPSFESEVPTSARRLLAERLNRECFCARASVDELKAALAAMTGDTAIGGALLEERPHLISGALAFISADDIGLMRDFIRAADKTTTLPTFRESAAARLPADLRIDRGEAGVFMGYDFHLTAEGPRLIEINTNAGGAFINAAIASTQRIDCDGLVGREPLGAATFGDAVIAMFTEEFTRRFPDRSLARIAIVDDAPATQYLYPEFLLAKRLFESRGIAAEILDARELDYAGGVLRANGRIIDLVYNRLTDFRLVDPAHAPLREAWIAGAVALTPSPLHHSLHADKRNLVTLSDSAAMKAMGLSDEDAQALSPVLPAAMVTEDNADALWAARRDYYFKPVSGFGSRAVWRGDKMTKSVWAEVRKGGYIAQKAAPPGERRVMIGGARTPCKADIRLYAYRGKILSAAARLYQGQTTNFRTPGGGFAPVFVI